MSAAVTLTATALLVGLGVIAAIVAIRTARTPQGAVGWVVFLVSFPLLAVPAFGLFGRWGFGDYARRRRASDRAAERRARGVPREAGGDRLGSLVEIAGRPLTPGNALELLIDGEQTFPAILKAIDEARDEVLVQFYIVRDDAVGRRLHAGLLEATRRGVRVHFLYDALGSLFLTRAYRAELIAAGVEMHAVRGPVRPIGRLGLNYRNHRKAVIVDGRLGFTGGLNLGDEYVDGGDAFASWRDTFVRIEGPMVAQLRATFAQDWAWAAGEALEARPLPEPREGGARGLVMGCGPSDAIERCSLFLCGLCGLARERLWIATPYLVPHTDLLTAVQLAAMRGVSVRVLVPEPKDHLLPWYASRDYFDDLQGVGAEVWEYRCGFMHSKVVLVDDDVACVGTINFDVRSVMLNFEATTAVEDRGFAARVAAMLEADFDRAALAPLASPSRRVRWLSPVARLFAPLL